MIGLSTIRRINLWPRLVVAVSVGFVILFVVLGFMILRIVDDSRDRIFEERLLIARMAARQVDSRITHEVLDLRGSVTAFDAESDSVISSGSLQSILNDLGDMWTGVYVLDSQFQPLAGAPLVRAFPPGLPQSDQDDEGPPSSAAAKVSDPFLDTLTNKPSVAFVLPIANTTEGDSRMLVGVMDLTHSDLLIALREATKIGHTGHAELVDGRGLVLVSTETEEFLAPGDHPEFYLRMQSEGSEGVETVPHKPREGELEEDSDADENHVMALSHLTVAPWSIAVGGSESETLAPVTGLRNNIVILGAVSLAFLWAITLVVARLLVRPVRTLTRAADQIAAGDLDGPFSVEEGGEIGRLGEALEIMRGRLKSSLIEISEWSAELETRVEDRTRELDARNRALSTLTRIATSANEPGSLDELLERSLAITMEHAGMEAGAIRLFDERREKLVPAAGCGAFSTYPCRDKSTALGECPCAHVAGTGEPFSGSSSLLSRKTLRDCLAKDFGTVAIVPIESPTGIEGVLYLGTRDGVAPDEERMKALTTIGSQMGAAIENRRLTRDLAKTQAQGEIDALKSEFMSSVSHELRTPLGFIRGYVSTLLRDDHDGTPDTKREFLEIVEEESEKLAILIDDLVDASKLHSGNLDLNPCSVRVSEIIEPTLSKLKKSLPHQRIDVRVPPEEPDVWADRWRVEQVLHNLIDNALKYSHGKPVNVDVDPGDTHVLITVRDEGSGIAREDALRIFEPFYRGATADHHSSRGSGLGLTICRGIVEAHGGKIWVETDCDVGATFKFTLPIAPAPDRSDSSHDGASEAASSSGARRRLEHERRSN